MLTGTKRNIRRRKEHRDDTESDSRQEQVPKGVAHPPRRKDPPEVQRALPGRRPGIVSFAS